MEISSDDVHGPATWQLHSIIIKSTNASLTIVYANKRFNDFHIHTALAMLAT